MFDKLLHAFIAISSILKWQNAGEFGHVYELTNLYTVIPHYNEVSGMAEKKMAISGISI